VRQLLIECCRNNEERTVVLSRGTFAGTDEDLDVHLKRAWVESDSRSRSNLLVLVNIYLHFVARAMLIDWTIQIYPIKRTI
jgi:hypothetical protein